jgi:hypothetical protein
VARKVIREIHRPNPIVLKMYVMNHLSSDWGMRPKITHERSDRIRNPWMRYRGNEMLPKNTA